MDWGYQDVASSTKFKQGVNPLNYPYRNLQVQKWRTDDEQALIDMTVYVE